MENFSVINIIQKLVGSIDPVGDCSVDEKRFENLKEICEIANELISIIDDMAYRNKDMNENSIKEMVGYANDFLENKIGIKTIKTNNYGKKFKRKKNYRNAFSERRLGIIRI